MDIDKLMNLRARHDALRERYINATETARTARQEAAHMQAELPDGYIDTMKQTLAGFSAGRGELRIRTMSVTDLGALAKLPVTVLDEAHISPHHVRRVIAAHTLADRLQRDAEALAGRVHTSQALMDRLNQYAGTRPEMML